MRRIGQTGGMVGFLDDYRFVLLLQKRICNRIGVKPLA
jgi:hypothetical protein